MDITNVRVKLMNNRKEKLRAFCSVTFDNEFIIRDIKVIEGPHGPFLAMPSRKITDHCKNCSVKNHMKAKYCNECGARLNPKRGEKRGEFEKNGQSRLHTDIAHPINSNCRKRIQAEIIKAYREELNHNSNQDYASADFEEEEHQKNSDDRLEPPPLETIGDNLHSHDIDNDRNSFDAGIY